DRVAGSDRATDPRATVGHILRYAARCGWRAGDDQRLASGCAAGDVSVPAEYRCAGADLLWRAAYFVRLFVDDCRAAAARGAAPAVERVSRECRAAAQAQYRVSALPDLPLGDRVRDDW